MVGSGSKRKRNLRKTSSGDSHSKTSLLYNMRKTPKDLFMKVRAEQSKSVSMHMVQGLAILLIIFGFFLLYYVNYELDIKELNEEVNLREKITDFSATSSGSGPDQDANSYAPPGSLVVEREFEND